MLDFRIHAVHHYGMNTQNQIKRTLSQPASIECVRGLLESEQLGHRTELAMRICEQFDFHDTRGQAQSASCLKALRELEGMKTLKVEHSGAVAHSVKDMTSHDKRKRLEELMDKAATRARANGHANGKANGRGNGHHGPS